MRSCAILDGVDACTGGVLRVNYVLRSMINYKCSYSALILAVGLAYVWAKGMLEWVKPTPKAANFESKIPEEAYQKYK